MLHFTINLETYIPLRASDYFRLGDPTMSGETLVGTGDSLSSIFDRNINISKLSVLELTYNLKLKVMVNSDR